MTRRDFLAFADELRHRRPSSDDFTIENSMDFGPTAGERYRAAMTAWLYAAQTISTVLRQSNARFDLDRFYNACGLTAAEQEQAERIHGYLPSYTW